ncbi:Uncharacterized protein BM_BM17753 [Brugia malayi]|uniref:Uncharacterized protein n=1 Tax=Brugia malayi TaxID=6279 RepID=A0A4E9FME1_BRUMA|nr:Uncharacterized protein BM_BM17753 [Brugia malayi]VIO98131.1 Uncharacterized protein BM_BM17753 [Brugia malayi]
MVSMKSTEQASTPMHRINLKKALLSTCPLETNAQMAYTDESKAESILSMSPVQQGENAVIIIPPKHKISS